MQPIDFYNNRITELELELKQLQRKRSALGWLRFGTVLGIVAVFYFLWSLGFMWVIAGVAALLLAFILLVKRDLANQEVIQHTRLLLEIQENELSSLANDHSVFDDGIQHLPKDHVYAADLDIFGSASLFQMVNRTTSEYGSQTLAGYLLQAGTLDEITQRNAAGKELSQQLPFVHHFLAEGKKQALTLQAVERLTNWLGKPAQFSKFKPWLVLRYVLPAIILTITFLFFWDIVTLSQFYLTLFVFAVIAYQIDKKVAPVHNQLSEIAGEMATLTRTVKLVENHPFDAPLLRQLKGILEQGEPASRSIHRLQKILERLDLRYNMLLSLPLNLFLMWNLQQMLDLEKWKKERQVRLQDWIRAIAAFEALNSFAILRFNRPNWSYAKVIPDYFVIEGEDLGHPLIAPGKRVDNPVSIPHRGCIFLLTGSNMAGKSTYLRSVGVNVVLALAGAPVCAARLEVSHVRLMTSMRIADNLEESTSTFYAELKKLKGIIEQVRAKQPVFILLDEILRGTNSYDRHTGSKALMKQFLAEQTAAIIATHDLELAHVQADTGEILQYHFDVNVKDDELFFDYKLKPGVCTSLNASILMRKIGIEV